jgi:prolyl 4-hydroxylase
MEETTFQLQSSSDVSVVEPAVVTPDWHEVSISETDGRRIMRFGLDDDVNRGEMLIDRPLELARPHEAQMMTSLLFFDLDEVEERRSMHLGLGAGTLTKYCSRVLNMETVAAEPNFHVIQACRKQFNLPPNDGLLEVLHADLLETLSQPRYTGTIDILFADAVVEKDSVIPLASSDFFKHCRNVLSGEGVMVLNVYGTRSSQSSAILSLAAAFGPESIWSFNHRNTKNKVMIAQCGAKKPMRETMVARAHAIQKRLALPALQWSNQLELIDISRLTPSQNPSGRQSASPELTAWIDTQLSAGTMPDDLLQQMTSKGWAMEVATQALLAQQALYAQKSLPESIQRPQITNPELLTWAAEQLAAGYPADSLIASMTEVGWSTETARHVLAVQQSQPQVRTPESEFARIETLVISRKSRSTPDKTPIPSHKVPEPNLQNAPLYLQAADRRVHVLQTLRDPRIVVFGNVLSDEECDELIALARPRMARSVVVSDDGGEELTDIRTSSGMFFKIGEFDVVKRIEARLAALVNWPQKNGEALQILRYGPGAEYKPHHDYFDPNSAGTATIIARGGQRVGTIIMYLAEPQSGGATVFPDVNLEVAPKKGNAVFFSYDRPDASTKTLHGGAPVLSGQKWVATKWLRANEFS